MTTVFEFTDKLHQNSPLVSGDGLCILTFKSELSNVPLSKMFSRKSIGYLNEISLKRFWMNTF